MAAKDVIITFRGSWQWRSSKICSGWSTQIYSHSTLSWLFEATWTQIFHWCSPWLPCSRNLIVVPTYWFLIRAALISVNLLRFDALFSLIRLPIVPSLIYLEFSSRVLRDVAFLPDWRLNLMSQNQDMPQDYTIAIIIITIPRARWHSISTVPCSIIWISDDNATSIFFYATPLPLFSSRDIDSDWHYFPSMITLASRGSSTSARSLTYSSWQFKCLSTPCAKPAASTTSPWVLTMSVSWHRTSCNATVLPTVSTKSQCRPIAMCTAAWLRTPSTPCCAWADAWLRPLRRCWRPSGTMPKRWQQLPRYLCLPHIRLQRLHWREPWHGHTGCPWWGEPCYLGCSHDPHSHQVIALSNRLLPSVCAHGQQEPPRQSSFSGLLCWRADLPCNAIRLC